MARSVIIDLISGTRPNLIKIAPLWHCLKARDACHPRIVHTGQHSEAKMSECFLHDLQLPSPSYLLETETGSHARLTGTAMIAYETLCQRSRPDWTVVVGDVDSTLACTLAAKKIGIPVAHLEAGLRSFDRTMPEELNRVLTDSVADLLWTPSPDADENLRREGIADDRIDFVGNIMIDALCMVQPQIGTVDLEDLAGVESHEDFALVTLHRPSNVDDAEVLECILVELQHLAEQMKTILPLHPRTRMRLEEFGLAQKLEASSVRVLEPIAYPELIALLSQARLLLTDSGGLQEESTYLGIPCLTLRPNTERPITITQGTNRLTSVEKLPSDIARVLSTSVRDAPDIRYWDGRTADRVVESLFRRLA